MVLRKAQQQKAQRKADKKAQKVTNIIAGLTAGQAVFKKALNSRLRELDEQQTFLLSNNAQQVKEVNNLINIHKSNGAYYNEQLKNVLLNHDKIKNIVLPTLGEERRKTYSPFLKLRVTANWPQFDMNLHKFQ